jgi:hypothetical protein
LYQPEVSRTTCQSFSISMQVMFLLPHLSNSIKCSSQRMIISLLSKTHGCISSPHLPHSLWFNFFNNLPSVKIATKRCTKLYNDRTQAKIKEFEDDIARLYKLNILCPHLDLHLDQLRAHESICHSIMDKEELTWR